MTFRDRTDAGVRLAEALQQYRGQDVIVYALPRGGVVLGVEVARSLGAPLDLIVVRKIGHPDNPEYAIAAVADDGHLLRNELEAMAIDKAWFDEARRAQQVEASRRRDLYLAGRAPLKADGKIAILVDDGLATGLSMALAIGEVRHRHPSKVSPFRRLHWKQSRDCEKRSTISLYCTCRSRFPGDWRLLFRFSAAE